MTKAPSETGFDTDLYKRFPTQGERPEGEKEELEKIRREALEDLEGLRDKLKEVEHEKDHLEVKLKEREDSAKDQIESLTLMLDEKYARVTQYGPYRSHGEADIEAHGLQPRAGGRERGEEL